ncbi:hypothetical protein BDD12DRAFT_809439 [Trichophaea hybrida]|nr:hypothetical protein BDD12DRAFT_809439 [Trichophaea hybrida]
MESALGELQYAWIASKTKTINALGRWSQTEVQMDLHQRMLGFLVSSRVHNHEMAPDPFVYATHVRRHPDFIQARAEACRFRDAGVSYNLSLQLKHSEGLQLSRSAYYNSKRTDPGASQLNTESGRIHQMFDSLLKEGFNVRTR